MQTTPLSRIAVEQVEELIDLIDDVTADGILTADERQMLGVESHEAYAATMATDDAFALGISMMRNGPMSQRTKRLTRQYAQDHDAA